MGKLSPSMLLVLHGQMRMERCDPSEQNIFAAAAAAVAVIIIIINNLLPSYWKNVLTSSPDQNHFGCPKVIRK